MAEYSLGIKELDDIIGGIRGGTNLMLIGPPMSGKEDIINHVMYSGLLKGDASIIVSTREPGEDLLEWFEQFKNNIDMLPIGIVDCVTKTLGIGALDTIHIKRASSPVDLTGIGVRISQYFEYFCMKKQVPGVRLCINSLSTILMYSNIQTVFRFLHVFTGRVKAVKGLGIYIVEDEMHDQQTIATLKQLFDGMVEIKAIDSGHAMRVIGLTPKPTPWFYSEVDGATLSLKKCE